MQAEIDHIREIETVSRGASLAARDPIVTESWRRCVTKHGLDPSRKSEAYILPDTALRLHRERSEELISIARSGIDDLYRLVAGQDYVLMLADCAGVTVEYLGSDSMKAELRRAGLYLGAEWSEARAGTCALGACIETGSALIVHQSDHFDATHGGLSCTAAPIYDSAGALSAVLDISLLSSPIARESQHLALNLVRQTARRVEMANLMAESRGDWVLRLGANPDFLDIDPEAAIRLDAGGHVTGMTHGAAQLMARVLGLPPAARNGHGLIGRRLSEIFALDFAGIEALTRQRPARDRMIEARDGFRLFAHAIEPRRTPARSPAPARRRDPLPGPLAALIAQDPAVQRTVAQAASVAAGRMPLVITGEPGTGRSRLAAAIHASGRRGPLITVACAGLAEEEAAVIFGRTDPRGTTTPGLIAAAEGGTLVLDQLDRLPERLLARLVPLIRDGSYRPIGSLREHRSGARIIVTCGPDGAGLHRTPGLRLPLPPLRDRRDLAPLAQALIAEVCAARPVTLSPDAVAAMAARDWPGNLHDLTALALDLAAGQGAGPWYITPADLPGTAARPTAPEAARLRHLLEAEAWNVSAVARALGVDRTTVHRQIRRHGLRRDALTASR